MALNAESKEQIGGELRREAIFGTGMCVLPIDLCVCNCDCDCDVIEDVLRRRLHHLITVSQKYRVYEYVSICSSF